MKSILKFGLVLMLSQSVAVHAAVIVTKIAAGNFHSLFLKSDGSLWATGGNFSGQLGDGQFVCTNRAEQIVSNGVVAIAGGGGHTLFLKNDGSLWGMGGNDSGALGDGTYTATNLPEQIVSSNVTAIAGGRSHSLFLKSDGSLWAMGYNSYGQLGDGTFNNTNRPEQIISNGVTAIAAGDFHSLFIKSDGSLWGMGYNFQGQLGDGTFNNANLPKKIATNGVMAISCGDYHSIFIKTNGSLWGMGWNNYGQLGDGIGNGAYDSQTNRPGQIVSNNVVAVDGGAGFTVFLKFDGSLWGMGWNYDGELGDGTLGTTNRPEQTVSSGVNAIACGRDHTLFLKTDGSVWGMGANYYFGNFGILGDGFSDQLCSFPEQVFPSPPPVLTNRVLLATNFQFTATCQFGGNFHLLAGTNLFQPLSQWTSVATNIISYRNTNLFRATLTNAVNAGAGQKFFILQSQ